MIRLSLLLTAAAILGCGGGATSSQAPVHPVDTATSEQWSAWGTEAQTIATLVGRMYTSQAVTRDALEAQIERTGALVEEIQGADPSESPVLDLVERLGEMENALQFVLEFSMNQGSTDLGGVRFRSLEDAVNHLGGAADALVQAASETGTKEAAP
jgi:hypothetical protein